MNNKPLNINTLYQLNKLFYCDVIFKTASNNSETPRNMLYSITPDPSLVYKYEYNFTWLTRFYVCPPLVERTTDKIRANGYISFSFF